MHHPDALPQRDPRCWPARHGCPVSRLCHLEIVHARDVLDDAVAGVVPDVYAEDEVGLGLHKGPKPGGTAPPPGQKPKIRPVQGWTPPPPPPPQMVGPPRPPAAVPTSRAGHPRGARKQNESVKN